MKLILLILSLVTLTFSQMFDKPNKNAPKELSQFQFMVGNWEGKRQVLTRNGYKETPVKMNAYYTYNGYGFHDNWFDDGVFWGTTMRIIDPKTKKWKNNSYNNKRTQDWSSLFEMEYIKEGVFHRENKWSKRYNLDRIRIEKISKDHFIWHVDLSSDNGKTWEIKNSAIMDMNRVSL